MRRLYNNQFNCNIFLVLGLFFTQPAFADTRLLRFPDIHGDQLVFTYAGNLWRTSSSGGEAIRLTAHPGIELFAKFSPDGSKIAFTGQYEGDEQVYVIPTSGGIPKKLTFYPAKGPLPERWGFDNQVYGWTADSKSVLFRSLRDWFSIADSKLYTVPAAGGLPTALPMPKSGAGALSPDGEKVVYSPLFRDFRTWKRYQGGWAQDLYEFDLKQTTTKQLTNHVRADRDPMWIGNTVYFNSDRTGKFNLYRLTDNEPEQLTHHKTWDVRWPSADHEGRIVYELNGALRIFDTRSGADTPIKITVPDDGVAMRAARVSAVGNIEDFSLSPNAKRAVFAARGDVFTVPTEHGLTRNLTQTSGVQEREVDWSADGETLVFVSDQSGEEELWLADQAGQSEPRQLTKGNKARFYAPRWAPDGKRIAVMDQQGRLYVVDAKSGEMTLIADDIFFSYDGAHYAWSPHGGWLAFSLFEPSGMRTLYLWSAVNGQTRKIGNSMFDEHTPSWSPAGDYLYYLSTREFHPQIGQTEWNYVASRGTGIFAFALRHDVKPLFGVQNNDPGDKEEDEDKKKDKDKKNKEKNTPKPYLTIEFGEFEEFDRERIARVPVEAGNYQGVAATKKHIFFIESAPYHYGREPAFKPRLKVFDIKSRKVEMLVGKIDAWVLSRDGEKLLVKQGNNYKLHNIKKGKKDKEPKALVLSGLESQRIPAHEWENMFDAVWRRFRDHFYVANMHGYDWEALREQYRPWLKHVAHRTDLNYLIGEMIAELNVSHAYISGGDLGLPKRPYVGLPGARFELDEKTGRYRISQIFKGHNEEEAYRSPLTEFGVGVNVADYVLRINGRELTAQDNPYELLQTTAGQPMEWLVADWPEEEGARTIIFQPLASEANLIYLNWTLGNMAKVAKATENRVGYLHIPDMGGDGIREFIKWYYPQIRKEGLIIDVRGNGGGNVSEMLINRLDRKLLGVGYTRTWDHPSTYPNAVFIGPMVTIINETSASDGDIFPWSFQKAGLGPLIGKRSWGGVVGITNHGPLLDGGQVYVPEFGNAGPDGQWVIEGYGVDPDIEVDNDPVAVIKGRDPQLERAIEEVMRLMQMHQTRLPPRPADPVK